MYIIMQNATQKETYKNTIEWLNPHVDVIQNARLNWRKCVLEMETLENEKCHIGKSIYETIPVEIKNEIHSFQAHPVKYTLQIKTHDNILNVCVYICFHNIQKKHVYDSIIEKMVCWLSLAVQYKPNNCAEKSLTIYLFMSSKKKQANFTVDSSNILLDKINVNSGQSNGCSTESEIAIYRKEEWFKVFIHETFHSLGLSFNEIYTPDLNTMTHNIMKGINVNQHINLFETHCEIMATIFNCLFFVLWRKSNVKKMKTKIQTNMQPKKYTRKYNGGSWTNKNIRNTWKHEIIGCLQKEKLFSIYQCKKIINKYCGENVECFHKEGLNWNEKTNVFAYYFVKTILLCNIEEFIQFMKKKNGTNSISLWDWNKYYIEDYVKFIFIDSFTQFKKEYFSHKKIHIKENSFLKNTMRMTIVNV